MSEWVNCSFFSANRSFAHFWTKNERFARKSNEQIPSPACIQASSQTFLSWHEGVQLLEVQIPLGLLHQIVLCHLKEHWRRATPDHPWLPLAELQQFSFWVCSKTEICYQTPSGLWKGGAVPDEWLLNSGHSVCGDHCPLLNFFLWWLWYPFSSTHFLYSM